MRLKMAIFLTVCLVVMAAPVVMATTILDTTLVQKWKWDSPSSVTPGWVDVIGDSTFDTKQINIIFNGSDVEFQIYTNYPLGGINFNGSNVAMADLALDLNGDNIFEKGIVLSPHANFSTAGLYNVSAWKSSEDFWGNSGYTYGGRYDESAPKIPYVQISNGILVSGVSPVQNSGGLISTYRYDVDLTGVNAGGNWNNLSLFWGTGTCNNDGIAGAAPVPEPATLLLLGSGLIGLAGLRKKFKK